jgi:hypothetical protein
VNENITRIYPAKGLSADQEYKACYLGSRDNNPISIKLVSGIDDEAGCSFWEIDKETMPGIYGFKVPPHLRSPGYTFVHICFDQVHPLYLELHGVDYDPYDSFALGLTTWIRSTCHEHLSSGLRKSMPSTIQPLLQDLLNKDLVE